MNMFYTIVLCLAIGLSLTHANSPTDTDVNDVNDESNENNWPQLNSTQFASAVRNQSNETNSSPNPSIGCGIRPNNRDLGFIVGGQPTTAHSHPWAVAVYLNSRFICGATIISEKYVLCAAHCVLERSPKNFKLKIGAHKLSNSGQLVEVKSVKVHENYDPTWMQNDIALFELKTPLNFQKTKNIAPVCLPNKQMDNERNVGQMSTIVGWGTLKEGGTPSDTLMQVQVPIMSNNDCIQSYNSKMITQKQLCAGFQNGGQDSCQGDSGGSLCLPIDKRYYQMGVVSWGRGCAQANSPGVYTRVSQYNDWISKNTIN